MVCLVSRRRRQFLRTCFAVSLQREEECNLSGIGWKYKFDSWTLSLPHTPTRAIELCSRNWFVTEFGLTFPSSCFQLRLFLRPGTTFFLTPHAAKSGVAQSATKLKKKSIHGSVAAAGGEAAARGSSKGHYGSSAQVSEGASEQQMSASIFSFLCLQCGGSSAKAQKLKDQFG